MRQTLCMLLLATLASCVRVGFRTPAADDAAPAQDRASDEGTDQGLAVDRAPQLDRPTALDRGRADRADAAGGAAFRLTAGYYHTCAILADGRIKCWGLNDYGQLGLGHTQTLGDDEKVGDVPALDLGTPAKDIGAGHSHTCALLGTGQVVCWGQGIAGNLGNESTAVVGDQPNEVPGPQTYLKQPPGRQAVVLSVQKRNVCVIYDDASLRCNGQNDYGQLGYETYDTIGDQPGEMGGNLKPVNLGAGRTALAVIEGDYHTCALTDLKRVKCWGRNHYGRLGYGDTAHRGGAIGDMGDNLPFVDLGAGVLSTALYRGYFGNCALLIGSGVKCWGANLYGELTIGSTNNLGDAAGEMGAALPVVSPGAGRTVAAARGGYHFWCLILDDRTLKCAGMNDSGQLGLGSTASYGESPGETWAALVPIDLGPGLRLRDASVDSLAVGHSHVCAILDNGKVKCWGDNAYGQLGLGDTNHRGDQSGEMGAQLPFVEL